MGHSQGIFQPFICNAPRYEDRHCLINSGQLLTAEQSGLKNLAITVFNKKLYVVRMLQSGTAGYVLKNALPEKLAEAITKVFAGKKFFSDEV